MLPYIEQANVLTAAVGGYDFHKDWNDVANQPATSLRIPTYECPSSPSEHLITPIPSGWTKPPATSDYWPVSRANNNQNAWMGVGLTFPGTDAVNGVLANALRTNIMAIPDGLSNTLMIGESGARQEGWAWGVRYSDAASLGFVGGAWGSESNNIVCAGTKGPPQPGLKPAGKVANGPSDWIGAVGINAWNQGELYSFHSNVCNVAFGDGSVRSLKSSISLAALYKLAARADGYPIDADN